MSKNKESKDEAIIIDVTLKTLKERAINAHVVGVSGVLGHYLDTGFKKLARCAKDAFNSHVYDKENNLTVENFFDAMSDTQKLVTSHQREAFRNAKGNPQKKDFLVNQYLTMDDRIQEAYELQNSILKTVIKFKFTPLVIDLDQVEAIQNYIFRDVTEYRFDISLLFPDKVSIDFMGTAGEISKPYDHFTALEVEDYFSFLVSPEEQPVQQFKNKIRQL